MKFNYLNQLSDNDDFEDIFKDFNFELLNSSEFKEDAVREEIVYPLLKKLGYSASGENKIIRSKNLKHPFYYFGTKAYNVNIIPDYTFQIDNENCWILDAKRPTENIIEGKNVYQAYSYAMHPEIQCEIYCLCNGKEFSIFNVKEHKPLLVFDIKNLKANWESLKKYLIPELVKKPHLRDFALDLGLFLLKIGEIRGLIDPIPFDLKSLDDIIKIEDDLYCINAVFGIDGLGDQEFMGTFDFNLKLYKLLLETVNPTHAEIIQKALKAQPFRYVDFEKQNKIPIKIFAVIGNKINTNNNESYLPFQVVEFKKGENISD